MGWAVGYQYRVDDYETVERLRSFICMLNEESEKGSVIVVEGRRDAEALSRAQLQSSRHSVNLSYKRTLARITNGKVRHVEDLVIYAPRMSGITGSRKDLYFYT
jgi:hypothetical protein